MAVSRTPSRVLVAFMAVAFACRNALHGDTKKLSQDQRVELLRGLASEYATAKIILPAPAKPCRLKRTEPGTRKHWEDAVRKDGPAARVGRHGAGHQGRRRR